MKKIILLLIPAFVFANDFGKVVENHKAMDQQRVVLEGVVKKIRVREYSAYFDIYNGKKYISAKYRLKHFKWKGMKNSFHCNEGDRVKIPGIFHASKRSNPRYYFGRLETELIVDIGCGKPIVTKKTTYEDISLLSLKATSDNYVIKSPFIVDHFSKLKKTKDHKYAHKIAAFCQAISKKNSQDEIMDCYAIKGFEARSNFFKIAESYLDIVRNLYVKLSKSRGESISTDIQDIIYVESFKSAEKYIHKTSKAVTIWIPHKCFNQLDKDLILGRQIEIPADLKKSLRCTKNRLLNAYVMQNLDADPKLEIIRSDGKSIARTSSDVSNLSFK